MCDVLLIAPFHDDLQFVSPEAQAVINALRPRHVLQGEVTEVSIYDALDGQAPFDGVWIASHADRENVKLSDTEIPHWMLAVTLAVAGVKWVVLNMCESDSVANQYARLGMDVVAVSVSSEGENIGDREAWRMGRLLAESLQNHDSNLHDAFQALEGADERYKFFQATMSTRSIQRGSGDEARNIQAEIGYLRRTVETFQAQLDKLAHSLGVTINVLVAVIMIEISLILVMIVTALFWNRG